MTRREFLKKSIYLIFSLPIFSMIPKKTNKIFAEPSKKEALYYKKLAG
jgi:hypothetical protein